MKLLRRNFLHGLLGIPALKAVKDIEVMNLKDEDTLVVKCNWCPQSELRLIKKYFKEEFPKHKTILLEPGMDIKVLRNGLDIKTNK